MKMTRTLFLALLVTVPIFAQDVETACATAPEMTQFTRELGAWSRARAQQIASKGLPQASAAVQDSIIVLPADETNTPFRRPFDLESRTLVFTPAGNAGFSVRNIPLSLQQDRGTDVTLSSSGEPNAKVVLDFAFPFYDRDVREIYVSAHNGIFLAPPTASALQQYADLDVVATREPVIAPLLSTSRSQFVSRPSVRVKKSADSVVITWSTAGRYEVQAVLARTGEIRFNYVQVTPTTVAASAIVITSGSESWRSTAVQSQSFDDVAGDARNVSSTVAPAVDISRVTFNAVADLDLYEVRFDLRGPVTPAASQSLGYTVVFGDGLTARTFRFTLLSDGRTTYRLPAWGTINNSDAVTVEGSSVTLRFLSEHVAASGSVLMRASTSVNSSVSDSAPSGNVTVASARSVRTDFSAISEARIEGKPIVEAFTLPILSVDRVWDQVKQSNLGLTDADVDGVAIYQNFLTDLVLFAGAYSTGGNAAASGLAQGDGSATSEARSPALMHMNAVGYGHNRTSRGASRVVLHEFGHRWLLFVSVDENGTKTRALNPVSAHPAQYVDTRAAFKVYTDTDTSVMGGGFFTTNSDGSFTSAAYGPYGYSWLDLYLMGLADASEVEPWYYIADSDPQLAGEYYAPPNQTYRGTRRDVGLEQVISGTGIRVPAARDSQRQFRVAFVLLTDREPSQFDMEQMQLYRTLLEADFRTATNGRGAVATVVNAPQEPASGPRRRAARP
jgi:hypothetical protein